MKICTSPLLSLILGLCPVLCNWSPSYAQDSQETVLRRIEGMIANGQYAAAERALRPLMVIDPSPRAHYLLGFTLGQRHRYDEAEVFLRQAVEKRPEKHGWLHALAKSLLEQGRNIAAMQVLDRAIALHPDPAYHFAKAMCALNVGDLETGESELRKCLNKSPNHDEGLYKLGKILLDHGKYEGSLKYLRACLHANPRNLEARFLLGLAESHVGSPVIAVEAFEIVLKEIPGHVGALYNLGRTLMRLGRKEEGRQLLREFKSMSVLEDDIAFYTRSVTKNPENLDGRLFLAQLMLKAGRTEEAVTELLAAQQMNAGHSLTYDLLAKALRRLGREQDAIRAEELARKLRRQEQ